MNVPGRGRHGPGVALRAAQGSSAERTQSCRGGGPPCSCSEQVVEISLAKEGRGWEVETRSQWLPSPTITLGFGSSRMDL